MRVSYFSRANWNLIGFVGYIDRTCKYRCYCIVSTVSTGSGTRSESYSVQYSSALSVTAGNTIIVLPFVTGVTLNKGSSANTDVQVTTNVYNSSHFQVSYTTSGSTQLYRAIVYTLTFDSTATQSTQTNYVDTVSKVGSNSVAQPLVLRGTDVSNLYAGMNSMNFSFNSGVNFNFNVSSLSLSCISRKSAMRASSTSSGTSPAITRALASDAKAKRPCCCV